MPLKPAGKPWLKDLFNYDGPVLGRRNGNMTNHDAAKLGFRLLALWFMANAAVGVAGVPYFWDPQWENVRAITVFNTLLPALVAIGIGVPLWFSADGLATRTFPGGERAATINPLRSEALFALALAVIGVLLICESLPMLINGLALFVQSRSVARGVLGPNPDIQSQIWHAGAKANVAAAAARLVIGAALFAGPADLARLAARVRKEFAGNLAEEQKGVGDVAVEQGDEADKA